MLCFWIFWTSNSKWRSISSTKKCASWNSGKYFFLGDSVYERMNGVRKENEKKTKSYFSRWNRDINLRIDRYTWQFQAEWAISAERQNAINLSSDSRKNIKNSKPARNSSLRKFVISCWLPQNKYQQIKYEEAVNTFGSSRYQWFARCYRWHKPKHIMHKQSNLSLLGNDDRCATRKRKPYFHTCKLGPENP